MNYFGPNHGAVPSVHHGDGPLLQSIKTIIARLQFAPFLVTVVGFDLVFARAGRAFEPVVAPLPVEAVVNRVGDRYVEETASGSLVVGISSPRGRRVWGFADAGASRRPDRGTLFEIGSITKTMTGTLLARLVLKEQVRLDDPVRHYFPDDWSIPRRDGRDISLLHLATHTSSLPRMPPDFFGVRLINTLAGRSSWNDPYAEYGLAHLKTSLAKIELPRPIGSKMVYSNLGARWNHTRGLTPRGAPNVFPRLSSLVS